MNRTSKERWQDCGSLAKPTCNTPLLVALHKLHDTALAGLAAIPQMTLRTTIHRTSKEELVFTLQQMPCLMPCLKKRTMQLRQTTACRLTPTKIAEHTRTSMHAMHHGTTCRNMPK
jgi:hypothetical protein